MPRPTVTIPPFPPAPASIEFSVTEATALNISPFTFQQQIQDWGGNLMEASVTWPAMTFTTAQPWVTFLRALKGQAATFRFNSAFESAYSGDIGTRNWALKSNTVKWSVSKDRTYGLSFEIREAI